MNHPCCGASGQQSGSGPDAPNRPGRGSVTLDEPASGSTLSALLAFAPSPTFAVMALATAVANSDPATVLCSDGEASAFTGMVAMYLLMSAFHAGPWLQLVHRRR